MNRLILLFFVMLSCRSSKSPHIDPFNYDPSAYEKVKLYYEIKGEGDTTLFFIHGWNIDHTYWGKQVPEFSSHYKMVMMDLAGCGQSGNDRQNWTIESFARDVSSIINKEKLTNVVLVGHSMGGEIALDVATHYPDQIIGIIGVDNLKEVGMTISEEDKKGVQPWVKEFIENYPRRAEEMARSMLVSTDSAVVHKVVDDYKSKDPDIAVATLINLYPKSAQAKDRLRELKFPIRFIMCTNTPYDEAALKKYCRNGYQIVTIDSSGHFPMIERPQQFNAALKKLLE